MYFLILTKTKKNFKMAQRSKVSATKYIIHFKINSKTKIYPL